MSAIKVNARDGGTLSLSRDELASLQSRIRGEIITTGNGSYEAARKVWNGLIDRKPGVIVRCREAADVAAAVTFAGERGIAVSARGGGHNVAGACLVENGYTIDLSYMRAVRVDPENRVAVAEGGARLGDLDRATQAFGLAAPVGVVSATGVAGLTLHGGVGWLLRNHGLSIDNLLSAEIVTADGRLRRADANENADLFWALRGGGGSFGVVTAFEFKVHPVGPDVWLSAPIYPLERAGEVMAAFRDYLESAPDELMGLGVYWSAPEAPQVPKHLHGVPVVILLGCYTGPFEKGEKVLEPLRRIGTPIADLGGPMRFVDVQTFLDADYPDGKFYYWKSIYLNRLDAEAIRVLSDHTAARPSPLSSIDVWTLGRAMSRVESTATAFFRRDAPYMIGIEANWERRDDAEANIQWARAVFEDLKKFSNGGNYLNFPGFFEEPERLLTGSFGENLKRLKSIKARHDPKNLFLGAINIPPDPSAALQDRPAREARPSTGMEAP
ncbi:MAG: FAD-binding oxidoreductase [Desulfobacterales bacterium]|nr:FAD-binding oxidoreductase [Desulfobacterales bacterium]